MNEKRKEAPIAGQTTTVNNHRQPPPMEAVAWKCTGRLWDAALAHSVTLTWDQMPTYVWGNFHGERGSTFFYTIHYHWKKKVCFQGSVGLLKILLFSTVVSARLTSIQGQAAISVAAVGIRTHKGLGDACAPYRLFPQAIHIVMILRCPSWLQGQTWTKVSFSYTNIRGMWFIFSLLL